MRRRKHDDASVCVLFSLYIDIRPCNDNRTVPLPSPLNTNIFYFWQKEVIHNFLSRHDLTWNYVKLGRYIQYKTNEDKNSEIGRFCSKKPIHSKISKLEFFQRKSLILCENPEIVLIHHKMSPFMKIHDISVFRSNISPIWCKNPKIKEFLLRM